MHYSTLRRLAFVTSSVLFSVSYFAAPAIADSRSCSEKLSSEIAVEPFRFYFGSLSSSKASGHHYILHCFRSDAKSRPMRFKWDKTGLQGVIGPGRVAFAKQEYAVADFEHSPAALWYGDSSTEIPTQILVPKQGVYPSGNSVTEARLIVPQDSMFRGAASAWAGSSADKNLSLLFERKGSDLDRDEWQAIDVDFESLFDARSETVDQSLRISVPLDPTWRNEQPNLWIALDDQELHTLLFRSPVAVPLRRPRGIVEKWSAAGIIGDGETSVTLSYRGRLVKPSWQNTQLTIFGPDARTVLASTPITYRR